MKITNNASFPVVAFCWDINLGLGTDVTIEPGDTGEVQGPYLGEMGGGSCYLVVEGDIVCQEAPDDKNVFQVIPGKPLVLANSGRGVTVRHYSDKPERGRVLW